jgi:hypothetical protein
VTADLGANGLVDAEDALHRRRKCRFGLGSRHAGPQPADDGELARLSGADEIRRTKRRVRAEQDPEVARRIADACELGTDDATTVNGLPFSSPSRPTAPGSLSSSGRQA